MTLNSTLRLEGSLNLKPHDLQMYRRMFSSWVLRSPSFQTRSLWHLGQHETATLFPDSRAIYFTSQSLCPLSQPSNMIQWNSR